MKILICSNRCARIGNLLELKAGPNLSSLYCEDVGAYRHHTNRKMAEWYGDVVLVRMGKKETTL
ncbi:MAG: hypothetical protein V2J65_34225 [Desulfobacteraceae bacterium]|nr:hypothetical protein [Desulfobacteraceae bacterium]